MIELLISSTVGRIFSAIGSVFSGIILGAFIAFWVIIKYVRSKIQRGSVVDMSDIDSTQVKTIGLYVTQCEKDMERIFRQKIKEKKKSVLRKKFAEIRLKRSHSVPIEPPDEDGSDLPVVVLDKQQWYPLYLLVHSIAVYYRGGEPLAFLELNEKQVFGIFRKVVAAVNNLFDLVGIDLFKKIKVCTVLETLEIVRSVLAPISSPQIKKAVKYSTEGFTNFMRFKSLISINPFYYLRRIIKRRITTEMTVECVKCAVDVIALEVVKIYRDTSES